MTLNALKSSQSLEVHGGDGHRVMVDNVMLRAFMLRTGVPSGLFDDFVPADRDVVKLTEP